jgi:poly-gamma-glutamate synthesis protein (capsule biosynthesis protein)
MANFKNKKLKFLFLIFLAGVILVSFYPFKSKPKKITIPQNESFIAAGVVPHHLLAKEIIEDFFNYISSKNRPETILIFSPDHFKAGSILGNSFITLDPQTEEFYGMKIDSSLIKSLSSENNLVFSNSSVRLDHGITNLLPFIKKYFPESKIVPIIIPWNLSQEKLDQFTNSLNSLSYTNTLVIASVDFSHYLPSSVAKFHDVKSIRTLINFQKEDFKNLEVDSWQALYIARSFARFRNKEFPKIIKYANSSDFLNGNEVRETTSYFSVVFEKGNQNERKKIKELEGKTILFVGDIMLDRGVEYLMRKNNNFYPFEKIIQFLRGIDIVVGNLEGPIVKNPPNFGSHSLRFAFSPEVIESLSFSNFNLLSLANNHTFDLGKEGFAETKEFLLKANIDFVGHPISCKEDFLTEKGGIIFLAFNKTFPFNCSDEEIAKIVKKVRESNPGKFLIVLLHWGQEYELKSSISQQRLAHKLIDEGADLIIGSHPHVVQEIEEYKGKLIFYSLGNFIFDQYFSKETQEGLAVGLEIYPQELIYRLFPIQSHLSQPFLMEKEKANEFLENLAKRSSPQLLHKIKTGIIEIER